MSRSSVRISETGVRGIPKSFLILSLSVTEFLLITAHIYPTYSGVLHVEGFPERELLSMGSRPSLKHYYHNFIWKAFESVQFAFL